MAFANTATKHGRNRICFSRRVKEEAGGAGTGQDQTYLRIKPPQKLYSLAYTNNASLSEEHRAASVHLTAFRAAWRSSAYGAARRAHRQHKKKRTRTG